MAEIYRFFNSAPGDERKYQANDFADYFGSVLSTGLLHTDENPGMAVSIKQGTMNSVVSAGKAIMQGYAYENTEGLTLTHSLPESTLDRIDRVVLRLDKRNQSRFVRLFIIEGDSAENPTPPELTRDNFIHEISLAQVRLRANAASIDTEDITDERLDEELCGLVYSLISIPTSQFQDEWDAFMANIQDEGFATNDRVDGIETDLTTHKDDNEPHEYGGRYAWRYNASTDTLDLVVY